MRPSVPAIWIEGGRLGTSMDWIDGRCATETGDDADERNRSPQDEHDAPIGQPRQKRATPNLFPGRFLLRFQRMQAWRHGCSRARFWRGARRLRTRSLRADRRAGTSRLGTPTSNFGSRRTDFASPSQSAPPPDTAGGAPPRGWLATLGTRFKGRLRCRVAVQRPAARLWSHSAMGMPIWLRSEASRAGEQGEQRSLIAVPGGDSIFAPSRSVT